VTTAHHDREGERSLGTPGNGRGRSVSAAPLSPLDEPVQRVGAGWVTGIALVNLGLFMAYFGPLAVLLPNQVQAAAGSAHKVVEFAWVTGIGATVAVVANPLAGALSDRTVSRFGRRHPWTLGGALASAVAMLLLAGQHTIVGITLGWCLAQAGLNAMQAGVAASVPDRVPVSQRGAVSGWIGIPQTVGVILASLLVTKVVTGNDGYLLLSVPVVVLARAGRRRRLGRGVETAMVGARCRLGYRLRGVSPDGRFVVEQRAFFEVADGKITWLRVLCSGFQPASEGQ
jgi:MFS family permease